ncbi:hypothetical protein SDC9_176855 [bioreactor metagenome]|uniref:Uncharacterized protein n=1 Tax=bioreactor metagenome TaxID=1076179 RepID=A0A645GTV1_9ZZZZ
MPRARGKNRLVLRFAGAAALLLLWLPHWRLSDPVYYGRRAHDVSGGGGVFSEPLRHGNAGRGQRRGHAARARQTRAAERGLQDCRAVLHGNAIGRAGHRRTRVLEKARHHERVGQALWHRLRAERMGSAQELPWREGIFAGGTRGSGAAREKRAKRAHLRRVSRQSDLSNHQRQRQGGRLWRTRAEQRGKAEVHQHRRHAAV